jgi:hypothetical protein
MEFLDFACFISGCIEGRIITMESKYHLVTSCSCSSVAEGKFDYSKEGISAGFSVGAALRLGSSFSLSSSTQSVDCQLRYMVPQIESRQVQVLDSSSAEISALRKLSCNCVCYNSEVGSLCICLLALAHLYLLLMKLGSPWLRWMSVIAIVRL